MPIENQSSPQRESFGAVPHNVEGRIAIPQASAEFRTVPNTTEDFGKIPQTAERKENHTLTVKETARMFEAAGVARTERSVINWCQPNRQGIPRLDSYYDPNERKYYITPQSVDAVIQEEIQRVKKSAATSDSEGYATVVKPVKNSFISADEKTAEGRKIEELEREVSDLKISHHVKDLFIDLLKNERSQVFERFLPASQSIVQVEAKPNHSNELKI